MMRLPTAARTPITVTPAAYAKATSATGANQRRRFRPTAG